MINAQELVKNLPASLDLEAFTEAKPCSTAILQMYTKEKLILDYLSNHNGEGYYIDIRNELRLQFDNEDDFDETLRQLERMGLIFENDNTTLYKLKK